MGSTQAVVGGVVGGVVGFMVGGPLGAGYGFAIGYGLGSMLSPMESPDTQQADTALQVQTSQRGMPIPVIFGTRKVPGNLIWYDNFKTYKHKQGGGKGGAPPAGGGTTYTYSASFAFAICAGEIADITKIWSDKDEIDMGREGSDFVIYKGTSTQNADSHMDGFLDRNTGYRGIAYVVFMDWDLGTSPRIPNFTFEVEGLGVGAENITTETNLQEFGAKNISGFQFGGDVGLTSDGQRIFVQDNAHDAINWLQYTIGNSEDTFSVIASYNVRSAWVANSYSGYGLNRRNIAGGDVRGNKIAFATGVHAVVYAYDPLSGSLGDGGQARTMCGTLYSLAAYSGQDVSWSDAGNFLAVALPSANVTMNQCYQGGPITVYQLDVGTDLNIDPTGVIWKQVSRSDSWQNGDCWSIDYNGNNNLAACGRYTTALAIYNNAVPTLAKQNITYIDSAAGHGLENWTVKWHPDNDRVAISHTQNNSRSISIYKWEGGSLAEDCWVKVASGGGSIIYIRDIEWSPDGDYLYGVGDKNIVQLYYDKITGTMSQRVLTTTNNSYTSAQYCGVNSLSSRLIVTGPTYNWIGAFQTKTTKEGSGEVTPPYVTERILTNDFWGAGINSDYLVSSVFTATKSYCLSNDYIISPVFRGSQSILDGLDKMIGYHDGYITCIDNKIRHEQLLAEDEEVVVDDSDEVAGGELAIAKDSERDTYNRIRTAYTNRDNAYTTGVVQRDAFAEQDYSGLRSKELSMMAFTAFNRADKLSQRLLKKWLNRPLNMTMKVGPKMKGKLAPGGVFGIDHTVTGINSMKGRITSISESQEDVLQIEFREEKDFLYDTTLANPPSDPSSPVEDPYNLRSETEDATLYMLERNIDKLGDPTRIIAGVTSQISDTAYAGAQVYDSPDGATYDIVKVLGGDATTGVVTAVDTSPGYIKSITVQLNEREETFTSYSSRDTFTNNNVNMAFWDDKKIRFQTITSQGSLSYLIEDLIITEPINATTTIGSDSILFLSYGNLDYVNYDALEASVTKYFKAPTFNYTGIEQNISSVNASSLYIGKENLQLKPISNLGVMVGSLTYNYSVVTLPSCNVTISWRQRSRLEGFGRKGYGAGGYGHSLTDDIVGWEVFVNSVSQGVHSETTFTEPTCTGVVATFGVRQVADNHESSSVEEITITRL